MHSLKQAIAKLSNAQQTVTIGTFSAVLYAVGIYLTQNISALSVTGLITIIATTAWSYLTTKTGEEKVPPIGVYLPKDVDAESLIKLIEFAGPEVFALVEQFINSKKPQQEPAPVVEPTPLAPTAPAAVVDSSDNKPSAS